MNNLAPMKNCPGGGVQGNLNWMPGYRDQCKKYFAKTCGDIDKIMSKKHAEGKKVKKNM